MNSWPDPGLPVLPVIIFFLLNINIYLWRVQDIGNSTCPINWGDGHAALDVVTRNRLPGGSADPECCQPILWPDPILGQHNPVLGQAADQEMAIANTL